MEIRVQPDNLEPTEVLKNIRSVVVYDDFGQAIAVMKKSTEGQVLLYRIGEAEFEVALKTLGIGLNMGVSCREYKAK